MSHDHPQGGGAHEKHANGKSVHDEVERTDTTLAPIVYSGVVLLFLTGAIMLACWFVIARFAPPIRDGSLVAAVVASHPEPRLKVTEDFDLARFRADQATVVDNYARLEGDSRNVRVPVTRAMRMIAGHPDAQRSGASPDTQPRQAAR